MKLIYRNLFAVFIFAAIVFVCADSASAQRREGRGKKFSKAQVEAVINRVEDRIDKFVEHFDDSLDNSRLDDTKREDWLMKRAKDLEKASDELRREFDRRDSWSENKNEVRSCLNIATDIDKNMRERKYSRDTETIWERVRFELNTLADIYNLPKVGAKAY
ncbi:MAG: hypothetical protein KIS76_00380 [Pyrinomonadaceae bacterium]|nr:hypothetical protein [Pyrinomonadaceae bacterium]